MSIALATRVQDFLSLPTFVYELCIVIMPCNKVILLQLTSCTEQIVQLMQERDILQDANNQMNEVSARKLQVSLRTRFVKWRGSNFMIAHLLLVIWKKSNFS